MKKIFLGFITFTLLSLSSIVLADKVIISGEPVVLEKKADVYVPSTVITTTPKYYYFSVGDEKRVCYKEVQPGLASVDLGIFKVQLGSDTVDLHCYTYSPDYFVVQ